MGAKGFHLAEAANQRTTRESRSGRSDNIGGGRQPDYEIWCACYYPRPYNPYTQQRLGSGYGWGRGYVKAGGVLTSRASAVPRKERQKRTSGTRLIKSAKGRIYLPNERSTFAQRARAPKGLRSAFYAHR